MVSSYKGTENKEQEQEMILVTHTQAGKFEHIVYRVFREECSAIDSAKRNGTLYRFQNSDGEWSAVDPNLIHFIGEAKQDEDQD